MELENKKLRKIIAIKLGKMPYEEISSNDLEKITEITLNARLLNGAESGIILDSLALFPNLKKLKLSNYRISPKAIELVSSLQFLEDLEIFGAEFEKDINFAPLEQQLLKLKFYNCLPITFAYPKINEIWLSNTDIDFSVIDLSRAKKITILNSTIKNIHDLTDFSNIENINFDGSTFMDANNEPVSEISVNEKTQYTHKSEVELFNESISNKLR